MRSHDLTTDHLLILQDAWQALVRADPSANLFFTPLMGDGLVTLRQTPTMAPARTFEVWHGDQLAAFLPLEPVRQLGRLTFPHQQSVHWRHRFLAEPLIDPQHLSAVCDLLLTWLGQQKSGGFALSLPLLRGDGAFFTALCAAATTRGIAHYVVHRESRPAMILPTILSGLINQSFEQYLAGRFSARTLKKLRAKRRKLTTLGPLRHEQLAAREDVSPWLETFLALEHDGWKGEGGTSILADPADRQFFEGLVNTAHTRGNLVMTRTVLGLPDGQKTIAASIDIRQGDHQYALKIAYDRAYGAYSPGVLHEIDNLQTLWDAATAPRLLDSCAASDHPVLDKLYADKITLAHLLLAPAAGLAGLPLRGFMAARALAKRFGRR
ncbi:MAG: GNAT family N-acetyltransferase [Pseudomonadota bacterium]